MNEAQKTQAIRLADVFIIGPVMVYAGMGKRMPETLRAALVAFGILTIAYNGMTYLQQRNHGNGEKQGI